MAKYRDHGDPANRGTKRCWSCNTHMRLHETRCPSCKVKVGPADEHGTAKKPPEWKNFLLATGATLLLIYFCWWAFIRG